MRLVSVLCAAFILGGALPSQAQETAAPSAETATSAPLSVEDARPANEKRRRTLSINIVDCSYGIWNIGDDQIDRIAQLQSDLTQQLGPVGSGKTLVVRRYVVLLNASARLTGVAVAAGLGSVGDFNGPSFSTRAKCEHERTPLGWFDRSELTTDFSPFVIEISVEFDGRPYELRTVYSPPSDLVYPRRIFREEGTAQSIIAMREANQRLSALILASSSTSASPARSD